MIYLSNALRPIESAFKKMHQLPLLVKCVGTVALVIFLAIHLARKFTPSQNVPPRLEPPRPVHPPAQPQRNELPLRPADPHLSDRAEPLFREVILSDWNRMIQPEATQQDISAVSQKFMARLQRFSQLDQFPDMRLSQLIPTIQRIPKEESLHAGTLELIRVLIDREQNFDAPTKDFLIGIIKNHKFGYSIPESIYKAVEEGRVYPSITGSDAQMLLIEELNSTTDNFYNLIYDLLSDRELCEKIVCKALALAPIGDSPQEIEQARLAFYFLHGERDKNTEEWRKKLAIIAAPLLRNCPNFILDNILGTSRIPFYPLLVQTLETCPTEKFLASFHDMKKMVGLEPALRDRLLKRLFSLNEWQIDKITPILTFLIEQNYRSLSQDEIKPILKWIEKEKNVACVYWAFQLLSCFTNAPLFLKHFPMSEDHKSDLKETLYPFCIWPEAQLTPEQQAFYAPEIEATTDDERVLYAHFFPGRFAPITLPVTLQIHATPRLNLTLINLSLNNAANLKTLRENWNTFGAWFTANSDRIRPPKEAAAHLLQIYRKVTIGCPAELKKGILSNNRFMKPLLDRAHSSGSIACVKVEEELAFVKAYPEVFSSLSECLQHSPDYLAAKTYVEECKANGLYPSEAKDNDPVSFTWTPPDLEGGAQRIKSNDA